MELKYASEPLEEVVFTEDDDGQMVPLYRSAVKTEKLAGGDMAYMVVEEPGCEPHIIVFGWKVSDELLSSGFVKTYVETIQKERRDLIRVLFETTHELPVFVW